MITNDEQKNDLSLVALAFSNSIEIIDFIIDKFTISILLAFSNSIEIIDFIIDKFTIRVGYPNGFRNDNDFITCMCINFNPLIIRHLIEHYNLNIKYFLELN